MARAWYDGKKCGTLFDTHEGGVEVYTEVGTQEVLGTEARAGTGVWGVEDIGLGLGSVEGIIARI